MNPVRLVSTIALAGVCALYALLTVAVGQRTTATVSYARVAQEARSVARMIRDGARRTPLTVAPLLSAGSLARVRTDLTPHFGAEVARIGAEDRTLVLGSWAERAVVVPVKDADEWDIVGAVALGSNAFGGLSGLLLIVAVAAILAYWQGMLAIRRLAEGDAAGGHLGAIGGVVALLLGSAVVIVRARLDILTGEAAIGPQAANALRFDPSSLALPNQVLTSIGLATIGIAAASLLLAAAWMNSSRRPWTVRLETWTAWSFPAPSALHLIVFTAAPLLFTLWVSMHDWDLLRAATPFVGLANYREMIADPLFWKALRNTAVYAAYVPVTMVLALAVAVLLNRPMRGVRVLRAMVFLPTVVSFAAIAIVWQWIFNADYGLLNYGLKLVGLPAIDWLGNPATALIAVMIVSAWIQLGYQMVVYLAGLQAIPVTLYEAATLDGASAWGRFRRITVPLLRPTSVYLFVTGIIWSFQVFTLVYVMTEGGPVHETDVLVYRIYQSAWEFRRMGLASAMSWFLFALLLILTVAQWKILNRRVEHAT
ncbi:MAG: sugar ABC transporter permease [Gemmatimonadaceae bacterium]